MPAVFLPVIAAVADAIHLTIVKGFFRRYGRLTNREYVWLEFAGIIVVLLLLLPFFGVLPDIELVKSSLWLLVTVIALATASNLLFFWGLEREKISEVEPFLLFNPLVAIIIAGLFYADERVWVVYLAAILASGVLTWSHVKRHRFTLTRALGAILFVMLLYGLEVVAIKPLLEIYNPLTLYFVRCIGVFVMLTIVGRPRLNMIKKHHLALFGILGALAVLMMVAAYTAFHLRGLTATIFVFTLSPVLVYVLSVFFLKEKWRPKNIIASVVIMALVVWVSLTK